MARFVLLCDWTDQGIRAHQDTIERLHQGRAMLKPMGVEIEHVYWTLGSHDIVIVATAKDGESLAASLLKLGGAGNIRTTTLRAFDEAEFKDVLAKAR